MRRVVAGKGQIDVEGGCRRGLVGDLCWDGVCHGECKLSLSVEDVVGKEDVRKREMQRRSVEQHEKQEWPQYEMPVFGRACLFCGEECKGGQRAVSRL